MQPNDPGVPQVAAAVRQEIRRKQLFQHSIHGCPGPAALRPMPREDRIAHGCPEVGSSSELRKRLSGVQSGVYPAENCWTRRSF
jgi:hypothetical protein